jgi:hypothetical protein
MDELIREGIAAFRETCYFGGCFILITQFTDGHINNKRLALALGAFLLIKVVA